MYRKRTEAQPAATKLTSDELAALAQAPKKFKRDVEEEVEEYCGPMSNWTRPALEHIDPATMSIAFQQIETDCYINGQAAPTSPTPSNINSTNIGGGSFDFDDVIDEQQSAIETKSGQRECVIRMYGVTDKGNSVCCHVTGFYPYIYIPAWPGMTTSSLQDFSDYLNRRLKSDTREKSLNKAIISIEALQLSSVWGYRDNKPQTFLKITLALQTLVAPAHRFLTEGVPIDGRMSTFTTYESNIPLVLRFMVDMNMAGGTWVELPATTYTIKNDYEKSSDSQIEVEIDYRSIISHPPEGEWLKVAPLRVLSFDIECAGRKGHFPTPEHDAVIQIATVVSLSTDLSRISHKAVHTLNTCAPIPGVQIFSHEKETQLLAGWIKHFKDADPDIIIGYNTTNFDFPYLLDRAKKLGVSKFPYFGRIKTTQTRARSVTTSSKQMGKQETKEINTEGRVQFDLIQAIRHDYKLTSYSLNAVSAHFLKQQKEDVHHSIITTLQEGTDDTRRRLAEYCVKDAILPLRLMNKLLLLVNYIEMARVMGVPISYLLSRGQSIKVVSQILRKAKQHGMIMPNNRKMITDDKYEGATVIEPIRGYYDIPIATLDFASLYPSIMRAQNLCYTTLTNLHDIEKYGLTTDDYTLTPNGDYFVKSHIRQGLLPEILQEIIAARSQAKKAMEAADDKFVRDVLNGRQLALKISANSVYGFTGATVGQLPCLAISSSVTAFGRDMIQHTKAVVEKEYTKANGYQHDAVVVYGDTDSVMIKFGVSTLEEAMELGKQAAIRVSQEFINPIKLEFEKVYFPYLLMAKKRYAGLYWTKTDKYDKIDAKGIETVRRDSCLLVRNVVTQALDTILVKRNPEQAIQDVKRHVADLLTNKVDLSLLVISKSLGKGSGSEDYAAKQAHVELAERMRKRDPLSAPSVGDRVPYIITKGIKGAAAYERSEDPLYVLENKIPIDTDYYLHNQLKKPLERIFQPILGDNTSDKLFSGEHTRKIKVQTNEKGSIFKFAQKVRSCMGCRVTLKDDQVGLCTRCEPKRGQIYIEKLNDVRDCEEHFGKLWSQCQSCQGSTNQAVLCESRDCPIFYRRKKIQIDLNDAVKALDQFSGVSPE